MSDLMNELESLKRRSRYHRKEALEAIKEGDNEQAAEEFESAREAIRVAIRRLEDLGVPDLSSPRRASEAEITIAEQLADCWGVLGGVYRSEANLNEARNAYDEGYKYESSKRFNILSTYNRLNRLVVRILQNPDLLSESSSQVVDIEEPATMRQLLRETDEEIERQLREGRRDRPWALADLAMVRLLGRLDTFDLALNALDASSANDPFPYDSMLKVIRELVNLHLPMQDELIIAGERLRARLPQILQGDSLPSESVPA
jgi:tetratricopeptide (TPR) repeat protein